MMLKIAVIENYKQMKKFQCAVDGWLREPSTEKGYLYFVSRKLDHL